MKQTRNLFLLFLLPSLFILLNGFSILKPSVSSSSLEDDFTACVKKYDSKWGENCVQCSDSRNSYRVSLRNTCSEKLDVKIAVQENDKRWKTFVHMELSPKDTMVAYACNGLGKYLVWAKKAGDKNNDFPTDNEINSQYTK